MEGGEESEAVLESLKIDPQLFINEVLNSVDDLLDEAIHSFHQQSSAFLKTRGTDRDQDLRKGVDYMHSMVQSVLDSHLGRWEKYCLHHCFRVPKGFSLPKPDELPDGDTFMDIESDTQLETLRNKLSQAKMESAELSQELQALERQFVRRNQSRKIINEVLQSCKQSSADEMIQEIMRAADELRSKTRDLKAQRMEQEEKDLRGIKDLKTLQDMALSDPLKSLCAAELKDLEELSDLMKK